MTIKNMVVLSFNPATTVTTQGSDIRRRTVKFVRVTRSFLSARQGLRRNTGPASSTRTSPRRESRAEGGHLYDEQVDVAEEVLRIRDIEEFIDIVKDGGESLRPQWDGDLLNTRNNEHQDLRTSLSDARVKTFRDQHFIPRPAVERLLTEEKVKEELSRKMPKASSQELDELVQQICSRSGPGVRLRIFATLILMDCLANINNFIRAGLSDKDLPLSELQLRKAFGDTHSADETGSREVCERFETQQWELCAPYFSSFNSDKIRLYDLDEKAILPFINDEDKSNTQRRAGGFATIIKVQIHHSQHSFPNQDETKGMFALKKLFTDDEDQFAAEMKAGSILSNRHPHLITTLGAFKHGETYAFFFPWAEGGDLRQFWKDNDPSGQPDSGILEWALRQCLGLAEGLSCLHNVTRKGREEKMPSKSGVQFGLHGDIKPENILYFHNGDKSNNLGTLKISDFGLTKFNTSSAGSHLQQAFTPRYKAPESVLHKGVVSQAYDVWSLGCLYLEFVTWMLTGSSEANEEFAEARAMNDLQGKLDDGYFIVKREETTDNLRAEIKPAVKQWIANLRQLPACSPPLQSLLDLIEHRMLVVEVKERITAAECVHILAEVASQRGSIGNLRLEVLDRTSRRVSTFDELRMRLELNVGHQLDWFPLPPVNRCPASAEGRLVWDYGGKEMSIILNRYQFERCRHLMRVSNPGILPTTYAPQSSSPSAPAASQGLTITWRTFWSDIIKALQSWQRRDGAKCKPAATAPPSGTTASTQKESYFCVDKNWARVKQTNMYTVSGMELLRDDCQLFMDLRKSLTAAQGSWLQRLGSWRICTGVKLSKFTFLFDNCDLVTAFEQKANGKSQEMCKGYEFSCVPDLDFDEHMQLMAETILQGLQKPELGRGSRAVLDGIPKLQAPPGIHRKQFTSGWGFYATQGFCLIKIVVWVGIILLPGVIFIPSWLGSKQDASLQDAFVPIMLLVGLVTILLAVVLGAGA